MGALAQREGKLAISSRYEIGVPRYPNGRKKPVRKGAERGNDRNFRRRQLFDAAIFEGGGKGKEAHDGVGQLMLIGQLAHPDYESARLMEIGREYARLYHERHSAVAPPSAKLEKVDRSTGESGPARRKKRREQRRFDMMNDALRDRPKQRATIHELVVDTYWTDQVVGWVSRAVIAFNTNATHPGLFEFGLIRPDDKAKIDLARAGLATMFDAVDSSGGNKG